MIKQIFITIALVLFSLGLLAQDLNYSQFYHNKMLINPAYTGINKSLNISLHHRNQWSGIGEGNLFQSSIATIDYGLGRKTSGHYGSGLGAGLIYQQSKTGHSAYTTQELGIRLASDAPRAGKEKHGFMVQFPVGISFSYIKQSFDWSDLVFSDNLDPVTGYIPGSASIPSNISQQAKAEYVSVGFGGMGGVKIKRKQKTAHYLSLGYSYKHYFSTPGSENTYELPGKWNIHSLYHFPVSEVVLSPGIIYRRQGPFTIITAGMQANLPQNLTAGLWFRNQTSTMQWSDYSDMIFNFSYQYKQFRLGYAYDMTISALGNSSSSGTHELFVQMSLYDDSQRRTSKRRQNTTCFFHGLK